jgi:hypothetical protein
MRHLKQYIERVSQEDGEKTDVDLGPKDPVIAQVDASEPDEVKELDPNAIVEPDPEHVAEQIKEYNEIKTSLEQYSDLVKAAKTRGGLRAEEGSLVAVGLRHFRNRLGLDQTTISQEDFGGTMSRDAATDLVQENIDEIDGVVDARIEELTPEEGDRV